MTDSQAYLAYPELRSWYNKLWLSEKLGYYCGPASIAPQKSDWYIVRPLMNLSGMGVGASKVCIEAGDNSKVPPGYFWCEWFHGNQYSVTYSWDGVWKPISCWQGIKEDNNLSHFTKWVKSEYYPDIGHLYNSLSPVGTINIEFIQDKPIEVHLRTSPDPEYNELVPVWKGYEFMIADYSSLGYTYISSYEDAEGFLEVPRLGFLVK